MNARVSNVIPRLDGKPWGGRKLEHYGLDLPADERIGEALVTAGEAVISDGFMAGSTLGEVVHSDPEKFLGEAARAAVSERQIFPLLVKLIDASENLSIQVHPNDEQATMLDRLGKTEAWHVLAAEPGSLLYLGLQPGVDFGEFKAAAAKLDGSSARLMRSVPAQPGTTIIIPAGTVHALGAGVMVYEVQQPSDVTYRMDDWGRVDAQGNPREMHLEAGFSVTVPHSLPELIEPINLRTAVGSRQLLTACRYFCLDRVSLPAGARIDLGSDVSPVVVTLLEGSAEIEGMKLASGSSSVVWPTDTPAQLVATKPLVALISQVPDLDRDVFQRAAKAGADDRSIAALGGSTGDTVAQGTH